MTRITDAALDEVRERGYTIVEGFLSDGELADARAGLGEEVPTHEEYFADPERYAWLERSPFAGLRKGPFRSIGINRLGHHPDLIDAAERFCGSTDIELYKTELWAKFAGAADYGQELHRDYGNHNLLVPRADGRWPQMTTFILLSDVTEADGPTMVVPRTATDHVARSVRREHDVDDPIREQEVPVTGPAGSLFVYTTDVFHRGSDITGEGRSRFAFLADFMERGQPWLGRRKWSDTANDVVAWEAILGDCTPRQREIYGFPPVGHDYWNEQTVRDTGARWPTVDMTPYADALDAGATPR